MQQEPKRQMQPEMAQPQRQQAAPEQTQGAGKPEKSAQSQFDMFMINGIKIVHSKPFTNSVVQASRSLSSQKDPGKMIDAIANLTIAVIERIEAAAMEKGVKIMDEVKISAANFLMAEIINIAEMSGARKLDDEQKAQAFSLAISMYLNNAVKSGKMTPEQVQQLAEQAKQTPEGQKIEQTRAEIKAKGQGGQGAGMQGGGTQPPMKPPMNGGGGLVAPKGGM